MRLHSRPDRRTRPGSRCRLCMGSGRVPYVHNHFDLWMVPCHACLPGSGPAGPPGQNANLRVLEQTPR